MADRAGGRRCCGSARCALELAEALGGLDVPDAGDAVAAGGGDAPPVRAEVDAVDPFVVGARVAVRRGRGGTARRRREAAAAGRDGEDAAGAETREAAPERLLDAAGDVSLGGLRHQVEGLHGGEHGAAGIALVELGQRRGGELAGDRLATLSLEDEEGGERKEDEEHGAAAEEDAPPPRPVAPALAIGADPLDHRLGEDVVEELEAAALGLAEDPVVAGRQAAEEGRHPRADRLDGPVRLLRDDGDEIVGGERDLVAFRGDQTVEDDGERLLLALHRADDRGEMAGDDLLGAAELGERQRQHRLVLAEHRR